MSNSSKTSCFQLQIEKQSSTSNFPPSFPSHQLISFCFLTQETQHNKEEILYTILKMTRHQPTPSPINNQLPFSYVSAFFRYKIHPLLLVGWLSFTIRLNDLYIMDISYVSSSKTDVISVVDSWWRWWLFLIWWLFPCCIWDFYLAWKWLQIIKNNGNSSENKYTVQLPIDHGPTK